MAGSHGVVHEPAPVHEPVRDGRIEDLLEITTRLTAPEAGRGKRPAVSITINGHSWRSRVAIMRGRNLLGLSNANRRAAGVSIGDEVEVDVALDTEPRV